MTTATTTVLQLKTVSPVLTVDDLDRSIRFFEGLGFGVTERWENDGTLMGVMMKAGEVEIGLNQDDWKKGRDRQKGVGMRLFFSTSQNVDELATRAQAAGITLDNPPHDTEWGTRAFEVTEPTGFKITIGSRA